MNPKRPTPRNIFKMPKFKGKERILKKAWKKQLVTYKGAPIRLSADFSTERVQTRRDWHKIFHVMKSKNTQPRFLYQARVSLK